MAKHPKTTTNQTQSGTSHTVGADSADIRALRAGIAPVSEDPSIPFAFANERERQGNSFKSPLGAYTTAAVRDAAGRSSGAHLGMAERVASDASRQASQERNFAQTSEVAHLTAPRTTQSTGTMQGTQVSNPGWGSTVSGMAGMGVGLL